MIDTHCHLLPGLDDGPKDEEASVALAAQLRADGVETVVCTPHFSRRFPTGRGQAGRAFEVLQASLEAAGIDLHVHLAAEVSPAFAMSADAGELKRRALGGRFCLVELLPDTPSVFFGSLVERLTAWALVPIFAHPERNRVVQRQPRVLDAARSDGALLQVVAPSITGRWGSEVEAVAWKLLESGRADLLASDAHRAHSRGSRLAAAVKDVERRLGSDAVKRLTETGPAGLLAATT